ncbi:MAG: putative maltokinase, partial [Rhizobiaceae bacterium]|nr:putative maltokinase [Rhizobiaceae bacterium]
HFPLMPRLFMAMHTEDRFPIVDILEQTPRIPNNCQWAIFLRNHDELTLEMVTAEERDYLWSTYASDTRARINLGIRRRLAPLMGNDRRKIELLNALLMSMPGTPTVYYGDEIGMGDNIYLGDRDGVRTPMQWSADRNGGFSRADPQRLYLPPIQDPIYGYQAINVEAQSNNPASQLNWTRRLIQVRRTKEAFGRGTINFLYPTNRKIIAYTREYAGETILCVANLSSSAQAVELDLAAFAGVAPVEMLGQSQFPLVRHAPYMLTLPAYGFFWFDLTHAPLGTAPIHMEPQPLPEFATVVVLGDLKATLNAQNRREIETVLPEFVGRQRWFAGKSHGAGRAEFVVLGALSSSEPRHLLTEIVVGVGDTVQRYFLPLSARWGEPHIGANAVNLPYTLMKLRQGPRLGAIIDGTRDPGLVKLFIDMLETGGPIDLSGDLSGCQLEVTTSSSKTDILANAAGVPLEKIAPISGEQSNTTIMIGDEAVLKFYRLLRDGVQPELEVTRFLTERTDFTGTPSLVGSVELVRPDGSRSAVAAMFARVENQGDAWTVVTGGLSRHFRDQAYATPDSESVETVESDPGSGVVLTRIDAGEMVGRRTGEMHRALATVTGDPAFDPEPIDAAALAGFVAGAKASAAEALSVLARLRDAASEGLSRDIGLLLAAEAGIMAFFDGFEGLVVSSHRTRIHGDYHLGQLLVAKNDVVILDFEGEPGASLEERRAKSSPLRDVAGMLRSFDYAAFAALDRAGPATDGALDRLMDIATAWRDDVSSAFIAGWSEVAGIDIESEGEAKLLDLFLLQKAFYELKYEAASRPAWLSIPLRGILSLLEKRQVL